MSTITSGAQTYFGPDHILQVRVTATPSTQAGQYDYTMYVEIRASSDYELNDYSYGGVVWFHDNNMQLSAGQLYVGKGLTSTLAYLSGRVAAGSTYQFGASLGFKSFGYVSAENRITLVSNNPSSISLSATSVYYGDAVTITINSYSPSFRHTLRYNWNGYTGIIAAGVTTSYVWTVPTNFIEYLSADAISTQGTIYCDTYDGGTLIGTRSVTLTTTIPPSIPTLSESSIEYGNSVTIYTNRIHNSLTHILKYNWNNNTGVIATEVSDSYNWTVPIDFMNYIPNTTSTVGIITVETYKGSTLVGSKNVNLTTVVPASVVPDFDTITHSEANSVVINAGINGYVKSLSKLNLAITGATGVYGSTIVSYKIVFDGVTYNAQSVVSNTVKTAGTLTITGTVTDSRGRSKTKSIEITVLDYEPPRITEFAIERSLADGTPDGMGTYAKVTRSGTFTTLNGQNTITVYIDSAVRGTSLWTTKSKETFSAGSFSGTIVIDTYDITQSYDFRIRVVDKFFTVIATAMLSTATVTMSWSKQGVGIGKVWQRGAVDVYGDVYINDLHFSDLLNGKMTATAEQDNLAIGWYTIAVVPGNGSGGDGRAVARFGIRDMVRHQEVIFYATHMYNAGNTITVLSQALYGTRVFQYIRIKQGGMYDGAVLQVYIGNATNRVQAFLLGDNFQAPGWVLKEWIPDAADPGDVVNYLNMTEAAKVDLSRWNGLATTITYTITLDTTWTGSAPPYMKMMTVNGISVMDNPVVDVVMSGDFATDLLRQEEWAKIYRITTADNSITLYATEIPTIPLPLQIKVVR